ncbi:MAG TPA: uridine diphosphate-N-acetylglucosamine-binding protein YvcK [Pseudogracilibacillus sp.]|nr:uridine diphosphate-N-acetylglucosamine-binding protein YvcK [Pseudogracilibacillus sp.]
MKEINRQARVVVIGGGTGVPAILKGIKDLPIHITSIITVADDGGSTGELRKAIDMPAPGDIRNVLSAMANIDTNLKELFQYRFNGKNGLSGHSLGNLILAAMRDITGDFAEAIERLGQIFQVNGQVYPVVNASVTLHAEMADGLIVTGESEIVKVENNKIERVFVTPQHVEAYPKAVEAIEEADLVLIAPGSLYTSIMPNIVIPGIKQALLNTQAEITYIANIMTQRGETDHYSVTDHIQAIHRHVGANIVNSVIVHNEAIDKSMTKHYEAEGSEPVIYDKERLAKYGIHVIEENMLANSSLPIRHSEDKIQAIMIDLLEGVGSYQSNY